MYHIDDLPYKPKEELPHIYGKFREKSEGTKVRALLSAPKKGELTFPKDLGKESINATEYLPDLVKDLGFEKIDVEA